MVWTKARPDRQAPASALFRDDVAVPGLTPTWYQILPLAEVPGICTSDVVFAKLKR